MRTPAGINRFLVLANQIIHALVMIDFPVVIRWRQELLSLWNLRLTPFALSLSKGD
jgi:hypothetical protein